MTIAERAHQLIQELGITDPSEIDIESIAYYTGMDVRYGNLVGCEASLIGYKDRAISTIDHSSQWRRKRFSIAHELGHWQLHRGESFNCRSTDFEIPLDQKPEKEKAADKFAAELLMPPILFRPLAGQLRTYTFDSIKELSDAFDTSVVATALRVIDMNVAPLILISHKKEGRHWFRASKMAQPWFPQRDLHADSFAMDVLYKGTVQKRAQKVGADAWFDKWNADRFELFEHSQQYIDGVLTLLTLSSEMVT